MKCPKCGKEIANDSVFCEYCGTHIVNKNAENNNCKVHIKWLLYVAMLFTCISNVFIFECPNYHVGSAAIWLLLIQLSIFIPASFLCYKKRIGTLVLVLSFFMLICNILLFIDVFMFDGYPDRMDEYFQYYIYGYYEHPSEVLLYICPISLLLCFMYEFYYYKKKR